MSKHIHHAVAHDAQHILHDIETLSHDEVESVYGIQLQEDGTVFDPMYNMKFSSVSDWATFGAEQEEMEYGEQFDHGKYNQGDSL